jgi:hypothetical protein
MSHLTAEHLRQLSVTASGDDIDGGKLLSREEFTHVQNCPECIEAFAEAVREGIRNMSSGSPHGSK